MPNKVLKKFTGAESWVCPAGVTQVTVSVNKKNSFMQFTQYAQKSTHAIFTDQFGNAWAMGDGSNGRLGVNDVTPRSSPVLVVGGNKFVKVLSESFSSYGLDQFGNVWSWGLNTFEQLGVSDAVPRSSPVQVIGGYKFIDICGNGGTSNGSTFYGLAASGDIYSWGRGSNGQLGNNSITDTSSPVLVVGGNKYGKMFAGSMFLGQDGTLYSWGSNFGLTGNGGTNPSYSSPQVVVGGLKWKFISSCSGASQALPFCAAIDTNGNTYTWGNNKSGQLGIGTSGNTTSSPIVVLGSYKFKKVFAIAAASNNEGLCMGITQSDDLYAWGNNINGQVGDGTVIGKSSPVLVLGGLKWKTVLSSGNGNVLGITTDGTMYGWGVNNGIIGLGDSTPRSSPVAVLGGLKFQDAWVSGGGAVYGLATDGKLYAWGANSNGQLGIGTSATGASPVIVVGPAMMGADLEVRTRILITIPGNTYAVNILQGNVMFGPEILAAGAYEELTLTYEY